MRKMLFFCSFFLLSPPQSFAQTLDCSTNQCIAVIDAGSSGSRLHVYAYDVNQKNGRVQIKERLNKTMLPGLASLNPEKNTIHDYLSRLMNSQPSRPVPVYMYATAGMRMLPLKNQKAYYDLIQDWFSSQSLWQLSTVKTISGKEEGLYSWLSVNYDQGKLFNKQQAIGVMDMGGASVQVVFPVKNKAGAVNQDIIQLSYKNETYTLFIHSFLGLGANETMKQYLDVPSCYPLQYPLTDGTLASGDEAACRIELQALVNSVHHVSQRVQTVLTENPVNAWVTLGGLAYLAEAEAPKFNAKKNQFTMAQLAQTVDAEICHEDWNKLQEKAPDNDYLFTYCLGAAYYRALVVDGYGLADSEKIHYDKSDWTKGVVVKAAYAIESKELQ